VTEPRDNAGIVKRSVVIAGHSTSVSLEGPFWEALKDIAAARGRSVQALVGEIDADRGGQNLSSAIRVFVLKAVQDERPSLLNS
jgi:predicted DNA-binding ribbon-helix-helix protein